MMDSNDNAFAKMLADVPSGLSMNEDFLNDLTRITKIIHVKKGDYLLRSGELCQDGYFINKGLFVNLYLNANGDEFLTGFAADDMYPFLSAIGYFTKQSSDFEIKAIENGELLQFSRDNIEDLSFRYPLFASYYQNIMMTIIYKLDVMLAVRLSSTSEEFIRFMYDHYACLINRVPDKYIARYMGITNAWYCKLKKKILPTL